MKIPSATMKKYIVLVLKPDLPPMMQSPSGSGALTKEEANLEKDLCSCPRENVVWMMNITLVLPLWCDQHKIALPGGGYWC